MTIILSLTLENGASPVVAAKFMYVELTDKYMVMYKTQIIG